MTSLGLWLSDPDATAKGTGMADSMKARDHLLDVRGGLHRVDLREQRAHRLDARGVALGHVHAGAVEVADELIGRPLRGLLGAAAAASSRIVLSRSLLDSPAAQRRLQRGMEAGIGFAARQPPLAYS